MSEESDQHALPGTASDSHSSPESDSSNTKHDEHEHEQDKKRAAPHPKIFAATLDLAKALEQRDAALKARRGGRGPVESSPDFVLPSPVQRSSQLFQLRVQAQEAAAAATKIFIPHVTSHDSSGHSDSSHGEPDLGQSPPKSHRPSMASDSGDTGSPPKSHRSAMLADSHSSDSSSSSSGSSSDEDEHHHHGHSQSEYGNSSSADMHGFHESPTSPPLNWRPAAPSSGTFIAPHFANTSSEDEDLPMNSPLSAKDDKDYASLTVSDALGWFSTNPDFVEMVERSDRKLIRYLKDRTNLFSLISCINNPTPTQDAYKTRVDAIPALAVFILTSPNNSGILHDIINDVALLDHFFNVRKLSNLRPEWSRMLIFLARGSEAVQLQAYMTAIENGVPRGSNILKSIFESGFIRNEHLARALFTLVNPEETINPWGDCLASLGLVEHLASRLMNIAASQDAWTYDVQLEAGYLADIVRLALAKCAPLAARMHDRFFTSCLAKIVFTPLNPSVSHSPHPIADVCMDIVNFMVEVSANSGNYSKSNLPPLVQVLNTTLMGTEIHPLRTLKQYLLNPTLQKVPSSLGLFRLKCLRCVHLALQGDFADLHTAFFTEGIFTACLDMIFMYKASNTLHLAVRELIADLLYAENHDLVAKWVQDSKLLDRIIAAVSHSEAVPEEVTRTPTGSTEERLVADAEQHQPAGVHLDINYIRFFSIYLSSVAYVPHLLLIAEKLNTVASLNASLSNVLKEHPKWEAFYTEETPRIQGLYAELGDVTNLRSANPMSFMGSGSFVA